MSRRRWIAIIAALAIPVGFVGVVLVDCVLFQFGACRVVRQKLYASPSGSQLIVVVWKTCGSATPDSTQASLVPRGQTFSPDSTPTFVRARGHLEVVVAWSSERAVRIGFIPEPSDFEKRDPRAGDVSIYYE